MKNKIKKDLESIINKYKFEFNTKEKRHLLIEEIRLCLFNYFAKYKLFIIDYNIIDTTSNSDLNKNTFSYQIKEKDNYYDIDSFINKHFLN